MAHRAGDLSGLEWREREPNRRHFWLTDGLNVEWDAFIPLGSKEEKASDAPNQSAIFDLFSNGVKTNNDAYVFDFDRDALVERAQRMVEKYNAELDRWRRAGEPKDVRSFLNIDERVLKFVRNTRRHLKAGRDASFEEDSIRRAMYRPFVQKYFFADEQFSEDLYRWPSFLPNSKAENQVLLVPAKGNRKDFGCLVVDQIAALDFAFEKAQSFPFYVYRADSSRTENLTDWALAQFRALRRRRTILRGPSTPDGARRP